MAAKTIAKNLALGHKQSVTYAKPWLGELNNFLIFFEAVICVAIPGPWQEFFHTIPNTYPASFPYIGGGLPSHPTCAVGASVLHVSCELEVCVVLILKTC